MRNCKLRRGGIRFATCWLCLVNSQSVRKGIAMAGQVIVVRNVSQEYRARGIVMSFELLRFFLPLGVRESILLVGNCCNLN